jgi:hypothetical protein
MQTGGERGIVRDAPEFRGGPIPEGPHHQFELRPAAQRRGTGEQPTHDGHCRAAQEQPHAALLHLVAVDLASASRSKTRDGLPGLARSRIRHLLGLHP